MEGAWRTGEVIWAWSPAQQGAKSAALRVRAVGGRPDDGAKPHAHRSLAPISHLTIRTPWRASLCLPATVTCNHPSDESHAHCQIGARKSSVTRGDVANRPAVHYRWAA
jgi:hypothetical protein